MSSAPYTFHGPTKVVSGPGLVEDLSVEFADLGCRRYLLVSDHGLEELGLPSRVRAALEASGVEVADCFLDVPENSELSAVRACADAAIGLEVDGLVALGGGSVIDTAKCADILLSEGGDLVEDYSGVGTLTRPLRPLVAIPTTAGTGSEVTHAAVILDVENEVKLLFGDTFLMPRLAVLDPELTLTLPPGLTASTAMDALTHAIESFLSPQWSPFSESLALGATRLVFDHVERAVGDGTDLEARGALLSASCLAGMAFSNAMVGCVHGMAHSVGGLFHVPHGVANAILLPYGLEYNIEESADRLAALSRRLNITHDPDDLTAAAEMVQAVRDLTRRLNVLGALPLRLRDVGVPEEGLEATAQATVMDGTSFYNPREVVAEEILESLRAAY